jgi:hypothetical protein
VIYAVDHVVFAVSSSDRNWLAARLLAAGLREIPLHLDFPEIGAASESFATASGAFVELVYETSSGRAPTAWFIELPRVIGIGFSSNDFERDIAGWAELEGAWTMNEDHALADGSTLNIHAAGPHPHFEDFYVFVIDRPNGLPYCERGAEARLVGITLVGQRADEWRDRLAAWFVLENRVGDIVLGFRQGLHTSVRASLTFETASSALTIELGAGRMRFVPTGETRHSGCA